MRVRSGAAAAVCVAVGLLLGSTTTSAAPSASQVKPIALREATQLGKVGYRNYE